MPKGVQVQVLSGAFQIAESLILGDSVFFGVISEKMPDDICGIL